MSTATQPSSSSSSPPLPHNIDLSELLSALTDPSMRLMDIAQDLGVTVAQVLDAAESPVVTSMLTRMDRLDRRRAKRAAHEAAPAAAQTLELLLIDRAAPPETRRKAATKLLNTTAATAKPRPSASRSHRERRDRDQAIQPSTSRFTGGFDDPETLSNRPIRPIFLTFSQPPISLHKLQPQQHQPKRAPPNAEEEKEGQKESRDQRAQRERE